MKIKNTFLILFLAATLSNSSAKGQGNDSDYNRLLQVPSQYTILKATEKINIDGKDDEKDWNKAPWTPVFTDIVTGAKPGTSREARCKMLWDKDFLYVFAEIKEKDIWASVQTHDLPVFRDNAFEMFIAPAGTTYNYMEFQINAFGTVCDLFMPRPYRNGGNGLVTWDIKGLQKAVHINGTLNDASDKDKSWNVELAIPFHSVQTGRNNNPAAGTIWRMNFSRVQWQLDTLNGNYFRKKDAATGRLLPEHYFVWSPQGLVNLHYPERWGYVLFADSVSTDNFLSRKEEKLKLLTWKYYYLQQQFKRRKGKYASGLKQLDKLYTGDADVTANRSHLKMYADGRQFLLEVFLPESDEIMSVNEEGEVHFDKQKDKGKL